MVLRDPVPILFSDAAAASPRVSVGGYLAARLVEAGCKTVFIVPGDFTLALLDELLKNQHLDVVGACNELNAGYAADGNSRATGGLACVAITFMVGGLSLLNAVAGAMAEDLPILIVSGAPNSNDYTKRRLIHHTLGEFEFYKSAPCFRPVVHSTFSVLHLADAPHMIDEAGDKRELH
jgi:pyruvate decarboxylase